MHICFQIYTDEFLPDAKTEKIKPLVEKKNKTKVELKQTSQSNDNNNNNNSNNYLHISLAPGC